MTTYQPDADTLATQTLSSNEMVTELIETTTNTVEIIETVISSLDQNHTAMVSHAQEGHLWKFRYGSVEVFVQLTGLSDEDTFTVWASVVQLPVNREADLTRKLLEMNWAQTFESRFAILENQIVVVASRSVAELSPGEISRAITVVATIADDNDESLQAEYA